MTRLSIPLVGLLAVLLASVAASGLPRVALAEAQESGPAQETGPVQEGEQEAASPGQDDPLSEVTTDEEEEALRLVERILQEQQMLMSGQNFVYSSGGRRDPFRNLLQLRQREIEAPAQRPPGLAGFLIGEVQVTAVASYQGRWQALLVGLDRRTYTAGVGAELYDGRIIEINAVEVVFEQEVQDLIGARSTRQVVRKLNNGTQE